VTSPIAPRRLPTPTVGGAPIGGGSEAEPVLRWAAMRRADRLAKRGSRRLRRSAVAALAGRRGLELLCGTSEVAGQDKSLTLPGRIRP
jgi:hypothetical protein